MAIPENQLDTWSHQGANAQSRDTYNSVKHVLEASNTPYSGRNVSIFLQGSYGNDTNIYSESDVDIVCLLNECWFSDLSSLSPNEQSAYHNAYSTAQYTHADFKRDVLAVLSDQYGPDITAGAKAIMIAARGNRRKSDVIVAVQYRRYYKFNSVYDQSFTEGICFFNSTGDRIANYPKQHSANLTRKHGDTNEWLKPMIRILKNMRVKLVADNRITADLAPSYYIEGLLYNVPGGKLNTNFQTSFLNFTNWYYKEADKSKLLCANEQYYLLWDNSHTSWPKANGEAYMKAICDLWNNW